jgi:hypothetical protein
MFAATRPAGDGTSTSGVMPSRERDVRVAVTVTGDDEPSMMAQYWVGDRVLADRD